MPDLLLYAPHPARCAALVELLERWPGLTVTVAHNQADYARALENRPDAMLADLDSPAAEACPCPHLTILPNAQGPATLARPVRWSVLAARLRLLLERQEEEADFAVGPYTCVPLERLVINAAGEEMARLTDKEVQLLRLLAHAHTPVGRSDLLGQVWGYRDDLDTHTLETHIYRLRQKIERDPAHPEILLTSESGYRLA